MGSLVMTARMGTWGELKVRRNILSKVTPREADVQPVGRLKEPGGGGGCGRGHASAGFAQLVAVLLHAEAQTAARWRQPLPCSRVAQPLQQPQLWLRPLRWILCPDIHAQPLTGHGLGLKGGHAPGQVAHVGQLLAGGEGVLVVALGDEGTGGSSKEGGVRVSWRPGRRSACRLLLRSRAPAAGGCTAASEGRLACAEPPNMQPPPSSPAAPGVKGYSCRPT